jgi:hypothetical protein
MDWRNYVIKTARTMPNASREETLSLGTLAAGWLAAHDPRLSSSPLSITLLADVLARQQDADLIDTWQRLGAHQSIRAFARQKGAFASAQSGTFAPVMLRAGEVWWNELRLGKLEYLFRDVVPQEAQVHLAYDTFLYRFGVWLERHCRIVIVAVSDAVTTIFVPDAISSPDIATAWQTCVEEAFSAPELQRGFVLLLNSILLSDNQFSVPDVPIITLGQADILIAFLYATLQSIEIRLRRLDREATELAAGNTSQQVTLKLDTLNERRQKQHTNYDHALARLKELLQEVERSQGKERVQRIRLYARSFTPLATRQLKATRNIIEKAVTRIESLLAFSPDSFFALPPLLSRKLPVQLAKQGGDGAKRVCYACGRALAKPSQTRQTGVYVYTANKLILQAPSQTLQGQLRQVEPEVCAVCAALSLVCPLKMATTGLIVSLSEQRQQLTPRYLYEHHLRMLTTGEQNTTAGRYLMIPCTEQGPRGKPMMALLGGKEYALLKLASLFTTDVLARFQVEAFFGADPVVLKQRHLIALRFLLEIFHIRLDAFRDEAGKQRYAAVADAIRFIERDHLIFAIYRLIAGFQLQTFSIVQRSQLEEGIATYKERLHMDQEAQLEHRLCDIAGLTGILFAFISHARSDLKPDTATNGSASPPDTRQRDRELKKLLEQVDNPNHFTYEAAGTLSGQMAQLWRSQQNHFIYDQARRLLQEAGQVEIGERETLSAQEGPVLKLYYDDICKVYAALFQCRYPTENARRDFTYELKLSLYSRFPELRPGNQNQ